MAVSSLKELSTITQKFEMVASLKAGERLHIRSKAFGKYTAPANPLSPKHHFFLRVMIRSIRITSKKLVQAFNRWWTKQSPNRTIDAMNKVCVEETLKHVKELTAESVKEKDFYRRFSEMGKIRVHAKESLQSLQEYRKTCLTGSSSLRKGKRAERKAQAKRVDLLIQKIQGQVLPLLEKQIQTISDAAFDADVKTSRGLLKEIFSKQHGPKKEEEIHIKQTYVTSKAARSALCELFGEGIVDDVLDMYNLKEDTVLMTRDLYALVTGIVSNLAHSDLKIVYANRHHTLLQLPKDYLKQLPNAFDQLTNEEFCLFLSTLRGLNLDMIADSQGYHKAEKETEKDHAARNWKYAFQLKKCMAFLEATREVEGYSTGKDHRLKMTSVKKKFGYAEYLCRGIVYGLFASGASSFRDGVLFPAYNSKGKMISKEAHCLVSKQGLHAMTVMPAQQLERPNTNIPVEVVFRGTYDTDSTFRDLNFSFEGPGRQSFNAAKNEMLATYHDHIAKAQNKFPGQKVDISFMGHSLGATDAQRMCAVVTEEIAKKSASLKHDYANITLAAFNAPAVERPVVERFRKDAAELSSLPFRLRYFDTENDPIRHAGRVRLGYLHKGQNQPANVKTTVIVFKHYSKKWRIKVMKGFYARVLKPFRLLFLSARERMQAHTFRCMSSFSDAKPFSYNKAYVSSILTDNSEDQVLGFGPKGVTPVGKTKPGELNNALKTGIGDFVKKCNDTAKKTKQTVMKIFPTKKTALTPQAKHKPIVMTPPVKRPPLGAAT